METPNPKVVQKIREALSLTDRLTEAMLQAHLTSRVPSGEREKALEYLERCGEIEVRLVRLPGRHGRCLAVPLIIKAAAR